MTINQNEPNMALIGDINQYNADEIEQRILNGDGGSWIKEPYDPDVIFQLDRYHIYQEILRKLSDKRAQNEARELFESEKIKELLEFIRIYADSVDSADEKDTKDFCRIRNRGNRYRSRKKESNTGEWVCRSHRTVP